MVLAVSFGLLGLIVGAGATVILPFVSSVITPMARLSLLPIGANVARVPTGGRRSGFMALIGTAIVSPYSLSRQKTVRLDLDNSYRATNQQAVII